MTKPRPPDEDLALGLGAYITTGAGTEATIRARPEDFQVIEVGPRNHVKQRGSYTRLTVRARNWETHRLARAIAKAANVPKHAVSYSGTKDKNAVTTQQFVLRAKPDRVPDLNLGDVEVLERSRVEGPTGLGMHRGNRFILRLRDLDDQDAVLRSLEDLDQLGWVPNWFGPQRFGAERATTHRVGEAILREDLEGAVKAYIGPPHSTDDEGTMAARAAALEGDWATCLDHLPPYLDHERTLAGHMVEAPDDPAGALKQLPGGILNLFVHAYQSLLFNQALARRIEAGHPLASPLIGDLLQPFDEDGERERGRWVPVHDMNLAQCEAAVQKGWALPTGLLVGYEEGPAPAGVQGDIEHDVLAASGFTQDTFRSPAFPPSASKGTRRPLASALEDLTWSVGSDDLGDHVEVQFTLPSGAYATNVLRELVKGPPARYG